MAKNPIHIFTVSVFLILIIGNFLIQRQKPADNLNPMQRALEGSLEVYPSTIQVAGNINNISLEQFAHIVIRLKNNSNYSLHKIKIIIPSIGLALLESPLVNRDTAYTWHSSDIVFSLDGLSAQSSTVASISAYASKKGTYKFNIFIDDQEGIRAATNHVVVTVE